MREITDEELKLIEIEVQAQMNKYGKGSIYKKIDKKTQFAFFYDDADGIKKRKTLSISDEDSPEQVKYDFLMTLLKRKYVTKSIVNTQNLNISEQTPEILEQMIQGLYSILQAGTIQSDAKLSNNITLNNLFDEYLRFCENNGLKYRTISNKQNLLKKLRPHIGYINIRDLNYDIIQNTIQSISFSASGEPLSKDYIKSVKVCLCETLKYAKKKKYISSLDFMDDITLPKCLKPLNSNKRFMTYENIARVLGSLSNKKSYYYIVLTLILTGVRPEEVLAIQKSDIDFEKGRIRIKQAVILNNNKKNNLGNFVLGDTKNIYSVRYVPAPKLLLDELKWWINYYEREYVFILSQREGTQNLLFINSKGHLVNPNSLLDSIQRYLARQGLDDIYFTLGGCRHCFSTFLYREKCPADLIDMCLGHAHGSNDILHKHYIEQSLDYLEDVKPYLYAVCEKLQEAIWNYNPADEIYRKIPKEDLIEIEDIYKYL